MKSTQSIYNSKLKGKEIKLFILIKKIYITMFYLKMHLYVIKTTMPMITKLNLITNFLINVRNNK